MPRSSIAPRGRQMCLLASLFHVSVFAVINSTCTPEGLTEMNSFDVSLWVEIRERRRAWTWERPTSLRATPRTMHSSWR